MKTEMTSDIKIKVTPRNPEGEEGQVEAGENPKENFWNFFRSKIQKFSFQEKHYNELSNDNIELILVRKFGIKLREKFTNHFWETIHNSAESAKQHTNIFIEVKSVEYESLDFILTIAGMDDLSQLLNSNFDLFERFLIGYVPMAFSETFINETNGPFQTNYNFSVDASDAREYFAGNQTENNIRQDQTSTSSAQNILDRSNKMWMITNFSLIVPVLLALAIFIFSYENLLDERKLLGDRYERIIQKEQYLLESYKERTQALMKMNEELFKSLIGKQK